MRLSAVLLALSLSLASFAEEAVMMNEAEVSSTSHSATRLSIAPGIAIIEDNTFAAVNLSALFPVSSYVYLGLTSAVYRKSESGRYSGYNLDVSVTYVPVLATFMVIGSKQNVVRPYFGVAAGTTFAKAEVASGRYSASDTETYFQVMARPGVEFGFSPVFGMAVEPALGILDETFVFATQVSFVFTL